MLEKKETNILHAKIDKDILDQVKAIAVTHGVTLTSAVQDALELLIKKVKKERQK